MDQEDAVVALIEKGPEAFKFGHPSLQLGIVALLKRAFSKADETSQQFVLFAAFNRLLHK